MVPGIRAAVEAERPDWVLVYGDTNSTLAGARGGRRGAGRPRRGRPAQLRPLDARGAKPDRGRSGSPRSCSAPTSAPLSSSTARASPGEREVVGDVMADAHRASSLRSRRAARGSLERLELEPGGFLLADDPPRRRTSRPSGSRGSSQGLDRLDEPHRLPRPPAHALRRSRRLEPHRARADRPGRLPRLHGARRQRARDRHRLGRRAEGGLLAPRPLRDAAAEHRVGRHGRRRRERARRRRPRRRSSLRSRPPRFPAVAPPLYGDGHARERIAAALYAWRP